MRREGVYLEEGGRLASRGNVRAKCPRRGETMAEEKNIHAGHRSRLLQTVVTAGLENISSVQAMEFILTYIFPRGDVNPIAHRLLDKFGSIGGVLDANVTDLMTINGIGERAAQMLSQLTEVFFLYTTCKRGKKEQFKEFAGLYDYCEQLLRFKTTEELYIIGMDCRQHIIAKRKLGSGSINMVGISPMQISNFLASTHAAMVFITHNHPGGYAIPSTQDQTATAFLENLCNTLGVAFIDHYLVGEDGIYGFKKAEKVRHFF